MFDPRGWLRFRGVLLRNWAALVVAVVWLLPVAGPFTGPVDASIITTGDVDPGGAATQPDPWAVGANLYVGKTGTSPFTSPIATPLPVGLIFAQCGGETSVNLKPPSFR